MVVTHGSSNKCIKQKLSVIERKMLRKICGPTEEAKGIWRIETNKELDVFVKQRNIINYVKVQRSSWFGHTNRMSETSIVKRIHKWKHSQEDQLEGPSLDGKMM